jgi:hypothetical protein
MRQSWLLGLTSLLHLEWKVRSVRAQRFCLGTFDNGHSSEPMKGVQLETIGLCDYLAVRFSWLDRQVGQHDRVELRRFASSCVGLGCPVAVVEGTAGSPCMAVGGS